MSQPPAKQFSGIFVSYRRDDSSGHAGRLSDRLVEHFGRDRIFMDIDTIEPGEDFVAVIENAVSSCEILVAIIGRNWLTGTGGTTGRLDNPNDFVRLEIATALRRDIRVIPVLVQRASMPKPQDLPEDVVKLTRRNAIELNDLRWQDDVDQLISVMERVLAKRAEAARLAEGAKQSEEERQRQEEDEKLPLKIEKQVLLAAEEEAKRRAAVERRREEGERERREAEERARLETEEASRRRAEDERVRAETEARARESNLAAKQRQPSTAIAAGDVSAPGHKSRRVALIAIASLIVLVVAAALIWRAQRGRNSVGNTNQAAAAQTSPATQTSPAKTSQTPAPAKPSPKPGEVVQNPMGIKLVYVPAGSFNMGSNTSAQNDEKPVHQVTFSEGFYVGNYEVTQAQWQAVMGNNPSTFNQCGGNCPVENVSWEEAQSFINKLNERNDEFKYRLPTEAQWEYACRAGTKGKYGGTTVTEMAWYADNSGDKTHPVGGKRPNDWGLADMHGNVWEWCQDWYHDSYNGAPTDGSAWLSVGEQKDRVLRGGSWSDTDIDVRSAIRENRGNLALDKRVGIIGFRLVAVPRTK